MAYKPLLSRLIGLKDQTPVPYSGGRNTQNGFGSTRQSRNTPQAQTQAMSAVGTLFTCVDLISSAVSRVNWHLYRKNGEEVTSHLALDVFNKPNPSMTRQEFLEASQQHWELTGESWWVVGKLPALNVPQSLWIAHPARMDVVPSKTEFLAGYIYHGPDDEDVPLALDEVIQLRRPDPNNPYRGFSSVAPILVDLDAARASAEWNRNYFYNSAEPGGVIEVPDSWSDDEFNEFTARWREQHQGWNNAHRIAVLENGAKWAQSQLSQRDMQFIEGRNITRDMIRESYRIHPHMLGQTSEINLANAQAADYTFATQTMVPRLERLKGALNSDFLPLFGTTGQGLYFDYESPVPEDAVAENAEITAKTNALVALVGAGADPMQVCQMLGLPPIDFATPGPAHQAPTVMVPASANQNNNVRAFAYNSYVPVPAGDA